MDRSRPSTAQVFHEHARYVFRVLRYLGVREADVPDVCQEVFITVHRKIAEFEGREFSFFKQVLTDLAVATIGQMGNEMKRLLSEPAEIDGVLRDGAERARAIAAPILREVEDIVGFLRP